MMIYLDDIRGTPHGWHRCFKMEEVQRLLCEALLGGEVITHMSLDHDLGGSYLCQDCYDLEPGAGTMVGTPECAEGCTCECHKNDPIAYPLITPTGYDLVKWMAQHDMWPVNKPMVHSANPVGRVNMQAVIDRHWHPPDPEKK